MIKAFITVLIVSSSFLSCNTSNENETFVNRIEEAHQKKSFLSKNAIQFDIKLEFGGKERLDAKITLLTNSSKGLIAFDNGSKIIFDGQKVHYSPDIPNEALVRFDAYTWAYFFLFPYKLSDTGTKWDNYENTEVDKLGYQTHKLTFEPGTGDAPDDWYVVYADKSNNLIEKVAYIVTVRGNKEDAEKDPHAIQYLDYVESNGIPIATKWVFWEWEAQQGLTNSIGNASLSEIGFITTKPDFFTPGSNFKSN
ncbi:MULTISPECIES: hypothetical protein [Rhodonellum]|nr:MULTISPECIES: hypothetical protein [Rhodonellum]